MQASTRARVMWFVIVTIAFGAGLTIMLTVQGEFDPVAFFSMLGAYVLLLLLTPLFGRSAKTETAGLDAETEALTTPGGIAKTSGGPTGELGQAIASMNRPVSSMPLSVPPLEAPTGRTASTEPFTMRNWTLYERTVPGKGGKKRVLHEFHQRAPRGARAIPLPAGADARWDAKKGKPTLIELVEPRARVDSDDLFATPKVTPVVVHAQKRICAAVTRMGDFCTSAALEGHKYCKSHRNFDPAKTRPELEVFVPRGAAQRAKPIKGLPGNVVVTIAKPKPRGGLRFGFGEPIVRTARPKPGKGFRVPQPELDVRLAKPKPGKAFRPKVPTIETRVARPKAAKGLKFRATEPVVRLAKPKAARSLKFVRAEPIVRVAKPKGGKRLRVADPRLLVRLARPKSAGPIRVAEPRLQVRAPVDHSRVLKQLRPKEPILEIRVSRPKAKPTRWTDGNVNIVRDTKRRTLPVAARTRRR